MGQKWVIFWQIWGVIFVSKNRHFLVIFRNPVFEPFFTVFDGCEIRLRIWDDFCPFWMGLSESGPKMAKNGSFLGQKGWQPPGGYPCTFAREPHF